MINLELENLPIDVTDHIEKFRDFLVACWPHLDSLMEYHDWDEDGDFIDDWLQLNWEILVEREMLEGKGFLTQFSMTHLSRRITSPTARCNYAITATSTKPLADLKTKKPVPVEKPLRLFSFRTSYQEKAFGLYPPFDLADLVLDATKELFIVPFEDLEFYLVKWEEPKP